MHQITLSKIIASNCMQMSPEDSFIKVTKIKTLLSTSFQIYINCKGHPEHFEGTTVLVLIVWKNYLLLLEKTFFNRKLKLSYKNKIIKIPKVSFYTTASLPSTREGKKKSLERSLLWLRSRNEEGFLAGDFGQIPHIPPLSPLYYLKTRSIL